MCEMNSLPAPSQASLACLKHNLAFLLDCFWGEAPQSVNVSPAKNIKISPPFCPRLAFLKMGGGLTKKLQINTSQVRSICPQMNNSIFYYPLREPTQIFLIVFLNTKHPTDI